MTDARRFTLNGRKNGVIMRNPPPFSPFRYLALLLPIPLLCWYWAGEALHRLEIDWVRAHPGQSESLAEACSTAFNAACDLYAHVEFTHALALSVLLFIPKFMALAASLPRWPARWQRWVLTHAQWLGSLGLLITFSLVALRGTIAAMTVWFIPQVWWNNDSFGVQLAAVIGVIAVARVPRHLWIAAKLAFGFSRRRTGRSITREECPHLWSAIEHAAFRLDVTVPEQLVLGVFPDCRLVLGRMTLDPTGQVVKGRILYLGATLATTLTDAQLRDVIEQALLRTRGKFGAWLPWAQDWLEASGAYLKDIKDARAGREIANEADPAIVCWDGWLTLLRTMADAQREEHAFHQKLGMEKDADEQAPRVRELLAAAAQAYRKDEFHLFIVNLSCGIHCPPVLSRFAQAFGRRQAGVQATPHTRFISPSLADELTLLEKEWLIKTGQATTPTDCWELRAA
jgi:hypothetical protein